MMRLASWTGPLVSLFLMVGCSSGSKTPATQAPAAMVTAGSLDSGLPFMTATGAQFGGNFRFIGANLDPWRFYTEDGEIYSRDDFRAMVQNAVQATGARIIRMQMNGGAFEPTLGADNEAAYLQLDDLIAACAEYKVYLLPALRDYCWAPYPSSTYDPYWYQAGGTPGAPNKDAILTDPATITAFKAYLSRVLNRVNTVSGVVYKNDPVIFGWEIINEPNTAAGDFTAWLGDLATYVKTVDPDHIVAFALAGSEYPYYADASSWQTFQVPQLDFIDIHYYPDPTAEDPTSATNIARIVNRVTNARTLGKPVIVGEFGWDRASDALLEELYSTLFATAFANGANGCLPYAWGPLGPNGWGGPSGFDIYTDRPALCTLIKDTSY